jgi:hypothetical protein
VVVRTLTTVYCERTGPGLWGEPLNAVSNVVFLVASGLLLWLVYRWRPPFSARLLPVLLGVVGLCSLSFHTFANPFTTSLDSLSILLFVLVGLVVTVRWMWAVRWRWAWIFAPAFLVFAVGFDFATLPFAENAATTGLGGYLPVLFALVGLAALACWTPGLRTYGVWMFEAAGVFAVSLTARTVDRPLCTVVPTGTHWVWHCLNAVVLFLVSYAVLVRACDRAPRSATPDPGLPR